MKFDPELNRRLIVATAETVIAHVDELSELDRTIGDGDHGLNMKRGFEAVLADLDGLASKPLPDLFKAIGTHLDVLVPFAAALEKGGSELLPRLKETASTAAAQTVPMRAVRGRASFLGERSIGHLDPGARSASLMIATICDVLGAAR